MTGMNQWRRHVNHLEKLHLSSGVEVYAFNPRTRGVGGVWVG